LDAVGDIIDLFRANTLAIVLCAKILHASRRYASAKEMYNKLKETNSLMDFDVNISHTLLGTTDTKNSSYFINIIYKTDYFNDNSKNIMRSLAVLCGTHAASVPSDLFVKWLSSEGGMTETDVENTLNFLISVGWVNEEKKNNSIWIHNLVADIIIKSLKPDSENCSALLSGLIKYFGENESKKWNQISELTRIEQRVFEVLKDNSILKARLLSRTAYLFHWDAQFEKAAKYVQRARDMRNEIGVRVDLADDIYDNLTLGHNNFSLENFNEAIENYENALKEAKEDIMIRKLKINIADSLEYRADYQSLPRLWLLVSQSDSVDLSPESKSDYEEAISIAKGIISEEKEERFIRMRAYKCISYAYIGLGNIELANENILLAIELADEMVSQNFDLESVDFYRLRDFQALITLADKKNYKDAIEIYEKSRKRYEELRHAKKPIGMSLLRNVHHLALAYFYDEDYEKAIEIGEEAVIRVKSAGDIPRRALIHFNLAVSYLKCENQQKSDEHFSESLRIAKKHSKETSYFRGLYEFLKNYRNSFKWVDENE